MYGVRTVHTMSLYNAATFLGNEASFRLQHTPPLPKKNTMPSTPAAATNHLLVRRLHVYTAVDSHGKNDQEKERITINNILITL